ncbi:MAG: alkaline phosphatase family protein [Chloroflexota bacterium]|nr:alkaline phosphatase family protein [Chloroflexota bacterium]
MTQEQVKIGNAQKVLVVGLDGATFDIIKPLIALGRLPNLGMLIDEGSHGPLRSTLPPITPTAWTSYATGKNPGQHGLFDFQHIRPETYDFVPVPANQHGQKSLWRILGEHDKKVVVIDVPFTYPPEEVNGYMITGYGTPVTEDCVFTYPPDLRSELVTQCGSCDVASPGVETNLHPSFFHRWDEILASRDKITDYLMGKVPWDFFMIVYGVTDNMQHTLWHFVEPLHPAYHSPEGARYREKLFSYYEKVDTLLGKLLVRAGDECHVLIMSDHGFGSTRTGQYLNKLLMDEGLLRYQGSRFLPGFGDRLMKKVLDVYHTMPIFSRLMKRLGGKQKVGLRKVLESSAILPTPDNTAWEETRAFPGGYGLQVYINLKGRYPQGTVNPGQEYEDLLQNLRQRLLALSDPVSGERIIHQVYDAREIYKGPAAAQAPDLIIEYTNFYRPGNTHAPPETINPGLEGNHAMDGIFIAKGPHILRKKVENTNITDLAPTILYLMGIPVPDDMDGQVLTDVISETHLKARPIAYAVATGKEDSVSGYDYTEEEMESIRDRLRSLGYI